MTSLDFAPLFRTAIGFDRLAGRWIRPRQPSRRWPPYNIEKTSEHSYRLTMAVAGFSRDDLTLTVQDATLIVAGRVNVHTRSRSFSTMVLPGGLSNAASCWLTTSSF